MKKYLLIILSLIFCFCLTSCGETVDHTGQAKTPSRSSTQKGRDYKEVVADFEDNGFTNIKLEKIEDLITGWLTKDGEVEEVSVGGDTNYSPDKWVDADIEVVIQYHTFKSKEEKTTENKTEEVTAEATEEITTEEVTSEATEEITTKEVTSEATEEITTEEITTEEVTSEATEEATSEGASKKENVLAYVKRCQDYNVYYVIDLDNKVAKYGTSDDTYVSEGIFVDGDNLNDGIRIKYYAGTAMEYTERVHWHYENHDSTLILVDSNGFEWEFTKTSMKLVPNYLQIK